MFLVDVTWHSVTTISVNFHPIGRFYRRSQRDIAIIMLWYFKYRNVIFHKSRCNICNITLQTSFAIDFISNFSDQWNNRIIL